MNLNGVWEFAFDDEDRGRQLGWHYGLPLERRIVVPFPYQSELSGINDKTVHEVVWYARTFEVPEQWRRGRDLLLHFGAVDYSTTLWVNGQEVGHNQGGHVPFYFDIAPYLTQGENRLTLRVEDRQDAQQPRGKQSTTGEPHDIDYYCTTGVWQTVWLEPAPTIRIGEMRITPDARKYQVEIMAYLHAPAAPRRLEVEVFDGETSVTRVEEETTAAAFQVTLAVPEAKLWSPDSPHLYDLRLRLYEDDELLDEAGLSGDGARSGLLAGELSGRAVGRAPARGRGVGEALRLQRRAQAPED
jgi:beta-galactosidase/beta-glucuronidase